MPGSEAASRGWRIFEGCGVALAVLAFAGIVGMRDTVQAGKVWRGVASLWHDRTDARLHHLERPELLIEIAQASKAAEKLEETAEIARANQSAIALVQQEQAFQRYEAAQRTGYLKQLLDAADVTPKPVARPAPRPDPPPAR